MPLFETSLTGNDVTDLIKINFKTNTYSIYDQMSNLTSFVKHLRPRFVKYMRKYLVVCIYGFKFRDMVFSTK